MTVSRFVHLSSTDSNSLIFLITVSFSSYFIVKYSTYYINIKKSVNQLFVLLVRLAVTVSH